MFSPIKIFLLLAVIGIVYVVARKAGFLGKRSEDEAQTGRKKGNGEKEPTDLVNCPDCGTFVASLEDHTCKK